MDFLRCTKMLHSVSQGNNGWLLIVWFKVHDDIIFIKLLGDGTCMNVYDLLKECIEIKKYGLDAGAFTDEDRERLSCRILAIFMLINTTRLMVMVQLTMSCIVKT